MTSQSPAIRKFSRDEFIAWVKTQSGAYPGHICSDCAMTRFGKAMMGEEVVDSSCAYTPPTLSDWRGKEIGQIELSDFDVRKVLRCDTFEDLARALT